MALVTHPKQKNRKEDLYHLSIVHALCLLYLRVGEQCDQIRMFRARKASLN